MYNPEKCDKCSPEDHTGSFCRCESRNIAIAKIFRSEGKSPWQRKEPCAYGCRNLKTVCEDCGREICIRTFRAPDQWIDRLSGKEPEGAEILCTNGEDIFIGRRMELRGNIHYFSTDYIHTEYPTNEPAWTHWMPLPPMPEIEK